MGAWYGQSLDNKPYLVVGPEGRLFASDPEGYRIIEFTSTGEVVRYWGQLGAGLEQMNLPTGLAYDGRDGLWVADSGNHRLLHFKLP